MGTTKNWENDYTNEENSNGNKIKLIDKATNKPRVSINGEILYKRKTEKIPFKDKDGNVLDSKTKNNSQINISKRYCK